MTTDTQQTKHYDLENVYDEQIAPLMAQIIKICRDNQIPMIASFAYAHLEDEDGPRFCTTVLSRHDGRENPYFDEMFRVIYTEITDTD